MHIPYYGEESAPQPAQSNNTKKIVALAAALVLAVNPVKAEDAKDVFASTVDFTEIEEVIVTAKDLSHLVEPYYDPQEFVIKTGFKDVKVIHTFDPDSRTWKFVEKDSDKTES